MHYSPLRYPGGKSKLAPFIRLVLKKLRLENCVYIEPFAGGAGIALDLLINGDVDTIVINDWDKAIASFWKAVVTEPERFIDSIKRIPLTVTEWERQKAIYENHSANNSFALGFSTFYLNRTNRSGIISGGGLIGGVQQKGNWSMSARFNKESLIERIKMIAQRRRNIRVYNKDFFSFVKNYLPKYQDNAFMYIDPPYFNKSSKLYKNYFSYTDHQNVEKYMSDSVKCHWIITYDDVQEIRDIYRKYVLRQFDLHYSAACARKASEIMIFSSNEICPNNKDVMGLGINYRELQKVT